MTRHPEVFAALAAPFPQEQLRTRDQAGKRLTYITARTAMNRLDEVLGPENWSDEYFETRSGLKCRLTITLPDGQVVSKEDGCSSGGDANGEKSTYSGAFKRAAVKLGVGRYLYRDGVPAFVRAALAPTPHGGQSPTPHGGQSAATPHRKERHEWQTAQPPSGTKAPARDGNGTGPRSGKGLFAWCKDREQRCGVGLLKYLNAWAKLQEFPGRMVDWDADQVARAHAEATRKLKAIEDGSQEVMEEAPTSC